MKVSKGSTVSIGGLGSGRGWVAIWQAFASAMAFGTAVFCLTGWAALGAWAAVAGGVMPSAMRERRRRSSDREVLEALVAWAETLSDLTSAGAGLNEAVELSLTTVRPALEAEVAELGSRLRTSSAADAFAWFGDTISTAEADAIVVSMTVANRRGAGSPSVVLRASAQASRERTAALRRIDAGRARTVGEAKLVLGISVGMLAMLIVSGGSFLDPYDTFDGQIALGLIGALVAGSVWAMSRQLAPAARPRVIGSWRHGGGESASGMSAQSSGSDAVPSSASITDRTGRTLSGAGESPDDGSMCSIRTTPLVARPTSGDTPGFDSAAPSAGSSS